MRKTGTIVKNVVEYIVSEIVEDKKSVKVDIASSSEESVQIEVRTSPDDMGRVIGKRGRVARAIRTFAQAAADEEGLDSSVEFID
ncbi:MAG: KH domain-containing protein [Flammeovirgaceae bacterium]|nr:MAG: KH domain-containing protein [Flammeovirgaceae bacterium]